MEDKRPVCEWCGKKMFINACGRGPSWVCETCDPCFCPPTPIEDVLRVVEEEGF